MAEQTDSKAERWLGRPWAARGLRALVYLVPFAASVLSAYGLGLIVPAVVGLPMAIFRFFVIALASTMVLLFVERFTRRLLPLAALLDLSLVFPDQAPSRFKMASGSVSAAELQRRLFEYQNMGANEPAEAAERLLGLVAALRDHDHLTRGHSERVRTYSQMIGEEMGLSGVELDRLRWAGLVHDVGKLRISPDILNKPGKLTAEEFEIIKKHPEFGAELAAPLAGWLGESVLAVVQHHERWDGKGYPFGLKGTEISLAARIVSVADTFDVMTSARSYKAPRSSREAREELARCAGTQFDANVVRAFLNLSIGKVRGAMGPLSWVAQLAILPRSVVASAAAPTANAVVAVGGAAAATVGGVAATYSTHQIPPIQRPQAIEVVSEQPLDPGDPVAVDLSGLGISLSYGSAEAGPPTDRLSAAASESTVPQSDRGSDASGGTPPATITTAVVGGGLPSDETRPPTTLSAGSATTTTTTRTITTTTTPTTTTAVATTTTTAAPQTTTTAAPPTTLPLGGGNGNGNGSQQLTGVWLLGSAAAGDVASQEILPLAVRVPLNALLPNLDTDRDVDAGLLIRKGGKLKLDNPTEMQRFRLEQSNFDVGGNVLVRLYAAPAGLGGQSMTLRVAVTECRNNSSKCDILADATVSFTGIPLIYQPVSVNLGSLTKTVRGDRRLEVWVIAESSSQADLWLAYDTLGYESTLTLS